jgi:glycosyltransferase involved in cell wall biosynthesis
MNVLYFAMRFPNFPQRFLVEEIAELRRRGHDVAVFALERYQGDISHDAAATIDYPVGYAASTSYAAAHRLLTPRLLRSRVFTRLPATLDWQFLGRLLDVTRQCLAFVDRLGFEVDVVHTHFVLRQKLAAGLVAAALDVPFTVTTHVNAFRRDPRWVGAVFERADRIVAISDHTRQHVVEEFAPTAPVDVVRVGIHPEQFSGSPGDPKRIVTVCRFVEKKGLSEAIDAVARVAEDVPGVEYRLIGSGPLEPAIHDRVRSRGLEEVVDLPGYVSDDQLRADVDAAGTFLLPCVVAPDGDRDGTPVALMEAMAMQTVPVTTTVGGIPEMLTDGHDGRLVDPHDPVALAEALTDLVRQREGDTEAMAANARRTVERRHDVAKNVDGLVDAFAHAVEANR